MQTIQKALRELVEMAQGYNATPQQILEVANKFDIEHYVLEGYYFDEMDAAGEE